jgi:hypothetical protein
LDAERERIINVAAEWRDNQRKVGKLDKELSK